MLIGQPIFFPWPTPFFAVGKGHIRKSGVVPYLIRPKGQNTCLYFLGRPCCVRTCPVILIMIDFRYRFIFVDENM